MVREDGIYEYYDFGLKDLKENVFLTKVHQKYNIYKSRHHNAFAYMSQDEKKNLLGDPTFRKRLHHLKEIDAIREIHIGKNPNNSNQFLYGYIPKEMQFKRKYAYLPFLTRYYKNKVRWLTPEAINIYETMLHSTIDITDEQLLIALLDSAERHNIDDTYNYVYQYLFNLRERITDFNSNSSVPIVEDPFGHRVHTFPSQIIQEIRKNYIYISGNDTCELDLHQSQMVILGKVACEMYGDNSFSTTVTHDDVYVLFGIMNGIEERGEQKKLMFRALFDRKDSNADLMFKNAFPDLYPFISNLKSIYMPENPSPKCYSNLAFILQREETGIFRKLWRTLIENKIKFLTAHDSIIIETTNKDKAYTIMNNSMKESIGNHINISIN